MLKRAPKERVDLLETGFRHWRANQLVGTVQWDDVEKVTAFKRDAGTIDFVCLEFLLSPNRTYWVLHDEVEGFWALVARIKEVFPDSDQRWEERVVKPAFAENATVILQKGIG